MSLRAESLSARSIGAALSLLRRRDGQLRKHAGNSAERSPPSTNRAEDSEEQTASVRRFAIEMIWLFAQNCAYCSRRSRSSAPESTGSLRPENEAASGEILQRIEQRTSLEPGFAMCAWVTTGFSRNTLSSVYACAAFDELIAAAFFGRAAAQSSRERDLRKTTGGRGCDPPKPRAERKHSTWQVGRKRAQTPDR